MEDGLITFPEKVGQIGDYAFYRCGGLQEVIVSSASTKLGTGALKNAITCDSFSYLRDFRLERMLSVVVQV
eukprot:scaffold16809_cov65-Cylindrotheca_fusiformis.AAC.2